MNVPLSYILGLHAYFRRVECMMIRLSPMLKSLSLLHLLCILWVKGVEVGLYSVAHANVHIVEI